jgi:hypothetical protein
MTKNSCYRDLTFCNIAYQPQGLLVVHVNAHVDVGLEEVKMMVAAGNELTGGKKAPLLMIIGEFGSFSKEAREFSANPEKENIATAVAYVINSIGLKLIANFYIRVNKPPKPVKVFNNEEDAVNWLKSFL